MCANHADPNHAAYRDPQPLFWLADAIAAVVLALALDVVLVA